MGNNISSSNMNNNKNSSINNLENNKKCQIFLIKYII